MAFTDKAREKEYKRKWQQDNKERANQYKYKWRDANIEKRRATKRNWDLRHNDKLQEYNQKRRTVEANTLNTLSVIDIAEIKRAGCLFCGSHDDLTIAHDYAVSKGGNTTRGNCFCLCGKCNRKMHTKSLKDILKQHQLPF